MFKSFFTACLFLLVPLVSHAEPPGRDQGPAEPISADPQQCIDAAHKLAGKMYALREEAVAHAGEAGQAELDRMVKCKDMPGDDSKLILVMPVPLSWITSPPPKGGWCCQADVLVLSKKDGKLIVRAHEDLAGPSESSSGKYSQFHVRAFDIDAAPYAVHAGTNVFGLRVTYATEEGDKKNGSQTRTGLSLFAEKEKRLEKILDSLKLSQADTIPPARGACKPFQATADNSLAVASAATAGYANLAVAANTTVGGGADKRGHCIGESRTWKNNFTLRFDGKKYPVPAGLFVLN